MNLTKITGLLAAAVVTLAWSLPADAAEATRTWVSGVGDDVNPCSRTAPCKTWAGAISKTAAGGEIDALDSGGFGPVTISKAITIDGRGENAGIVASLTTGIIVKAGPSDAITIRNITINGALNGISGIKFVSGGSLHVEHVAISGFSQFGLDFASTTQSELYMNDVHIHEAAGGALNIHPSGVNVRAMLEQVRLTNNLYGLLAKDGVKMSCTDIQVSGNTGTAIEANSATAAVTVNVSRSLVSGNGRGLVSSGAHATIRMSEVSIFDNDVGLAASAAGAIVSIANNRNFGNATAGAPTAIAAN